jgi:hypothetical protein
MDPQYAPELQAWGIHADDTEVNRHHHYLLRNGMLARYKGM